MSNTTIMRKTGPQDWVETYREASATGVREQLSKLLEAIEQVVNEGLLDPAEAEQQLNWMNEAGSLWAKAMQAATQSTRELLSTEHGLALAKQLVQQTEAEIEQEKAIGLNLPDLLATAPVEEWAFEDLPADLQTKVSHLRHEHPEAEIELARFEDGQFKRIKVVQ